MLANAIQSYKAALRKPELLDRENEILEAKRQELLEMARVIFPNENISFDTKSSQEKQIQQIAKIQARLDVYAYTNRKDLDGTRDRIAELNGLENKVENREELLKELEDLKTKYKVFGRYVEDKDWEDLYRAKFEVLMSDINQREESPLKDAQIDASELEYYKRILQKKIEEIITGRNEELKRAFGTENLIYVISQIKEMLKEENIGYNVNTILEDITKLRLILSFDVQDGLDNMTVNYEQVKDVLDKEYYEWAKNIPMKTIEQLLQPDYNIYLAPKVRITNNKLIEMIDIHRRHMKETAVEEKKEELDEEQERIHIVPEGIVRIGTYDRDYNKEYGKAKLYEKKIDKVVFPKTLKTLGLGFVDGTHISDVVFQEGLEEIGEDALSQCEYLGNKTRIKMPSTLKRIGRRAFSESDRCSSYIILNEGLEEIADFAFTGWGCGPDTVLIIPSTVKKVGKQICYKDRRYY